jgi:hypothetical protein
MLCVFRAVFLSVKKAIRSGENIRIKNAGIAVCGKVSVKQKGKGYEKVDS